MLAPVQCACSCSIRGPLVVATSELLNCSTEREYGARTHVSDSPEKARPSIAQARTLIAHTGSIDSTENERTCSNASTSRPVVSTSALFNDVKLRTLWGTTRCSCCSRGKPMVCLNLAQGTDPRESVALASGCIVPASQLGSPKRARRRSAPAREPPQSVWQGPRCRQQRIRGPCCLQRPPCASVVWRSRRPFPVEPRLNHSSSALTVRRSDQWFRLSGSPQ